MADTTKEIEKKEASTADRIERTWEASVYTPQVDIVEKKEEIVVFADMPGVDEKSVDINLEKNVLSIFGKVDDESIKDHKRAYAEYGVGDFERVFTLSDEIDRDRIQATVKNGVLKLVLPKAEAMKSRKITVKAEA
jgi:HSP20 family molecular chaperone IbpA